MHAIIWLEETRRPLSRFVGWVQPTRLAWGEWWVAPTLLLLQLTTAQKVPYRLDAPTTISKNTVVQYESKIAIAGQHVHFFSNWQFECRIDRDGCVLGGEPSDWTVWIISKYWGSLVLADRFLTDVEDGPIAGWAADDGGHDGQCREVWFSTWHRARVVLACEDPAACAWISVTPADIGGVLVGTPIRRRR